MTSRIIDGLRRIFQHNYLFQLATIILFIVCLHPVYRNITLVENILKEHSLKLAAFDKRINELQEENANLKIAMLSAEKEREDNRKQLTDHQKTMDKTETRMKELDKNISFTKITTDKHNSTMQYLLNFTSTLNVSIVKCDRLQVELTQRFDTMEGCQSGYEVGEHTYPTQAFPLDRTIHFDPPFKNVPAFSYGTTLLDSTSHLSVHLQLISLTESAFTIKFSTWGRKYALYGARISWMACPK